MKGLALLSLITLWSVTWTGTEAYDDIFIPEVYYVHLEPNFTDNTFKGNVTVDFHTTLMTSEIAIHRKGLTITNINIGKARVHDKEDHPQKETVRILLDRLLNMHQQYRLTILYEGILGTAVYGFYRSKYTDGTETKWIATTHFESTGARHAFPCWDHPDLKAYFDISITHPNNYTAVLSNMPVKKRAHHGETTTTYFHRTMKMSTYLLAFMVTDYTYKPHVDNRIKIYTRPGAVNYTEYAWNFTGRALKVMDEYTGIPYFKYINKMDQATVPTYKDDTTAMENWGLVIYKEEMLLYEEGVTKTEQKEEISKTIAHEVAHQWFGNMVTPQWWSYVWLKEGFAGYFEAYILDKLEPTWRVMDMFVVETMQKEAFQLDSQAHVSAMDRPVKTWDEIMAAYDEVSYSKAACVIRMFSHILTENVFRTGLRSYLREHEVDVADSSSLLRSLNDASGNAPLFRGRTFTEVAVDWVKRPGFPLVTVTKVGPGNYILTQRRFFENTDLSDNTTWSIPITYATNHRRDFNRSMVPRWLSTNNITFIDTRADWILVNNHRSGYYRVNYDEESWQALTDALWTDLHQIHPINRAQLIDDVFTMAEKDYTTYEIALNLSMYLTNETDYVPWMTAFKHLGPLGKLLFMSEQYPIFKCYMRHLMTNLTKHVTYEPSPKDDHTTKILRAKAMEHACRADVVECLDAAHKQFNAWLHDPHHKIDPDLRNTIICTGLRTAGEEVWEKARSILRTIKFDPESDDNPLEPLGCNNDVKRIKRYLLNSTESGSGIGFKDAVQGVLGNTNLSGVDIVQEVLDTPKMTKVRKYPHEVLPTIAESTVNFNQSCRLTRYNVMMNTPQEVLMSALNRSNKNIKWIETHSGEVGTWLVKNEKTYNSSGALGFASLLLILSIFIPRCF